MNSWYLTNHNGKRPVKDAVELCSVSLTAFYVEHRGIGELLLAFSKDF